MSRPINGMTGGMINGLLPRGLDPKRPSAGWIMSQVAETFTR